jgi:tetratricopeptide (TPR) repeat protein
MRCRFLLAAVAAAVIVAEGVSSPRPAVAAGPQPAKRASAAENFEYATHHLTRGQWFERAAGQLRAAARSEPDNGRYRLALGCALASRAASLAYTATFVQAADAYRRSYPERLAAWEAAKKEWDARLTPSPDDPDGKYDEGDPRDPGERPEPPPPLLLRTKDDNQRFRLTPAQAKARVAALAAEAKAEWEKAEALAATPDDRAEAQHVRGWGLWLLARNEKNFLTGLDGKDDGESATAANLRAKVPDEVRRLLQAATEAAPENARYWQALGDALLPDRAKAEKAYRRALELDPLNPALWQRLYLWKGEKHTPPAEGEETPTVTFDPKAAIDDLKRAAQADPLNAFPLYLLAGVKLRETDYGLVIGSPNLRGDAAVDAVAAKVTDAQRGAFREALEFIERGNRAPRYEPLRYRPAVPALLAAAWGYQSWLDEITNEDGFRFFSGCVSWRAPLPATPSSRPRKGTPPMLSVPAKRSSASAKESRATGPSRTISRATKRSSTHWSVLRSRPSVTTAWKGCTWRRGTLPGRSRLPPNTRPSNSATRRTLRHGGSGKSPPSRTACSASCWSTIDAQ